ncbi:DMT family transporter [Maricaulaceae bacterium MS644]
MAQSPAAAIDSATDARAALTGVLVLLAAACVLGFAPILVKASELGPQAIAFWRLAFALPVLGVWLLVERRRERRRSERAVGSEIPAPARPAAARMLLLAGLFFAGDLAFWHAGIKLTTAANATLLANLTPIPVTIAALFLFGERITPRFIIAGALALGGAGLLSVASFQFAPERIPGDVLSALTSCWYAAYLLAVRAARRAGAATVQVMFWSTLIATPLTLGVALVSGEALAPSSLSGWAPLIALGLIVHCAGQGGVAFGLGRTPAALASLIILVQPVVAAAAGWWLFAEALVPVQWAGAALVLLGVYAAQRARPALSTPAPGAAKRGS